MREALEYFLDLGFTDLDRSRCEPQNRPASASTEGTRPGGESSGRPRETGGQPVDAIGLEARREALTKVEAEARQCRACTLCETRQSVVFGSGSVGASLMLIGEGPGAEEDRQGLPFVGAAGELLTKILAAIELRREDVYIANIVKCRPPGNRDPSEEEALACRRFLHHQIDLVQPRVIVALGRIAAQNLLETQTALGRLRDQWHEVRGVPTRVTYHPAALLRNVTYKRPTWEDMKLVRERLSAGG